MAFTIGYRHGAYLPARAGACGGGCMAGGGYVLDCVCTRACVHPCVKVTG